MHFKSISRKLIFGIILFSSLITLILTGIQLYSDYKSETSHIHKTINNIKFSSLRTITSNLWIDDKDSLNVVLDGINALPDISYVALYVNDSQYVSKGNKTSNDVITEKVPITYTYNNKIRNIGVLYIEADLSSVYQRLINRFWIILASNAFKTFLVAIFIFLMVNKIVIDRLKIITDFIHSHDSNNFTKRINLISKKKKASHDEVDEIVNALNQQQLNLEKYFNKLIEAKEEAESASQAKSEFLSQMSHELRTPLNAVLGFSQLLELDEKDEEKKKHIQAIINGGIHLLELVNEALDLEKIESGSVELSIGNHSLHKIINDSLSMIKPLADKHVIQINNKVSSLPDINISVDEMRFKQVVLNIISNAIKYNHEDGIVTIDCSSNDENMLSLSITDTGKGFTDEQLSHLFEPFERFGAANSNIEGAGLGLVIAENLIDKMGGTITVESELGKGSCFSIQVPLS